MLQWINDDLRCENILMLVIDDIKRFATSSIYSNTMTVLKATSFCIFFQLAVLSIDAYSRISLEDCPEMISDLFRSMSLAAKRITNDSEWIYIQCRQYQIVWK